MRPSLQRESHLNQPTLFRRAIACATAMLLVAAAPLAAAAPDKPAAPRAVKVMVITLFAPEAAPWLDKLPIRHSVRVPGLSAQYPEVKCTDSGVCVMTTGMGHANAAASTVALALSRQFDLSR